MEGQPVEPQSDPTPRGVPRRAPGQRPRRRGRPWVLLVVWALVIAVVFFVGLVIGRALEDAPTPGGTQTLVRTLKPSTVGPSATVTVKTGSEP